MWRTFFTPFIVFACTSPTPPGETPAEDTEINEPPTEDTVEPTPVDPPQDSAEELASDYPGGRYRVRHLEILPTGRGLDLNGDGAINNQLPGLLETANLVLGPGQDYDVATINDRIAEVLLNERTIVMLEAEHTLGELQLDLLQALRDDDGDIVINPSSYDLRGNAIQRFNGAFSSQTEFEAGPGTITLPFQFGLNEPILLITAAEARIGGSLDVFELDGAVAGAFPVTTVMNQIVEPLIESNIPEDEQQDLLDLITSVIDAAADLEIQGTPAISGAFKLEAEQADW